MRADLYQWALIISLAAAALLTGAFLYHEIYPQYQIFQNAYVKLEEFRSSYTGEPPPSFKIGIKQIVIPASNNGPETIDRCISCHVAVIFPHFSPTRIAHDVNGNVVVDINGNPIQEPNPDYIWGKVDEKINSLKNEKVNRQLLAEGKSSTVDERLKQAKELSALKTAEVDGIKVDMTKVLAMHPLIGNELHPFDFHPESDFGCTSCHGGNGRGLVMDKAHGPVFDEQYQYEAEGYVPEFTETDRENDPKFARVFNYKPNYQLIFQTTPILPGALIQSRCVQCHNTTNSALDKAAGQINLLTDKKNRESENISQGIANGAKALKTLVQLRQAIQNEGYLKVLSNLEKKSHDYTSPETDQIEAAAQKKYLSSLLQGSDYQKENPEAKQRVLKQIDRNIQTLVGSTDTANELAKILPGKDLDTTLLDYFKNHPNASGSLFAKVAILNLHQDIRQHFKESETSFQSLVEDQSVISAMQSDIDLLTKTYNEGENLYITQACYACHRIAGYARGGVGPELTKEGYKYPWFIKQSIVWPQADLRTSTMPNMLLDHEEVEALTTYLLGQRGENKSISNYDYKAHLKDWEEGKPAPWEKPLPPEKILDVRNSMTIFATEGCASCHRLKGFESNIGFREEKTFEERYQNSEWFQSLFPEDIIGSKIVSTLEKRWREIDDHIIPNARQNAILEDIDANYSGVIESLYSTFKYALRAKNKEFEKQPKELAAWKERVRRVLMVYIQEYGLGRLIGPRLNWSGIFRTDQWLMQHFHNPTETTPKSLMPVFPFDDSKFYALTYMLDQLAKKNRDEVHQLWENRGFNPELAFHIHCAQCHGDFRHGNGPVSEWIYPPPKNLANAIFLRNLTKERAMQSIEHGVKGTPMPPWGEVAKSGEPVLNEKEVKSIVDWLFFNVPGHEVIGSQKDVLKWQYKPEDVINEMKKEGNIKQEDIFDVGPPLVPGPEQHSYFIKKKYYTKENLKEGQAFFDLNCAPCHGKEADGTGLRAATMTDAKPRILTNLNWINTRDDLRLLRSIKYGVPGTAMTPWGDLTSSLQRMQLVMYIRSLSLEHKMRQKLSDTLYHTFDKKLEELEQLRSQHYADIANLQEKIDAAKTQREKLFKQSLSEESAEKQLAEVYQSEIELRKDLAKKQKLDEEFQEYSNTIKKERDLYLSLGTNFLLRKPSEDEFDQFLLAISDPKTQNQVLDLINKKIEELVVQKQTLSGEDLVNINADILAYEKLKAKMTTGFYEEERLRQKEKEFKKEKE